MSEPKFKVGDEWKTREGKIVSITGIHQADLRQIYPVIASNGISYSIAGETWIDQKWGTDLMNLIYRTGEDFSEVAWRDANNLAPRVMLIIEIGASGGDANTRRRYLYETVRNLSLAGLVQFAHVDEEKMRAEITIYSR